MSITIPFSPEIEAKLRERAAASGKDLDAFIRQVIEENLASSSPIDKPARQWTAEFDAWMNDVKKRRAEQHSESVVDDSRDSIYDGRGE